MNVSTFFRTIAGSFLAGITLIALHILAQGNSEEPVRLVIRYTSRLAAFLFVIIFSSSAIHKLVKTHFSTWLIKYRPHLGLVFAVIHTLHLISLVYLQNQLHPVFTLAKNSSLLAGGIAYFFIYLMVFTTHPEIKARLKPSHWKLIHLTGSYWIWIIFFNTYLKKVLNHSEGYVLLILFTIGLILRFYSKINTSKNNLALNH